MAGKTIGDRLPSLGFTEGALVQEFGYDEDVDFDLRDAIEELTGSELEDEDYRGVADAVLAWWRSDDGDVDDLTDYLVDCAQSLENGSGMILCVVPSSASDYHVSTTDVSEAARAAGQSATTTFAVSSEWTAIRLTSRGR